MKEKTRISSFSQFINGNTVQKASYLDIRRQRIFEEKRKEEERRRKRERVRRIHFLFWQQLEESRIYSVGQLTALTGLLVGILFACAQFLSAESGLLQMQREVASLKSNYQTLASQNDAKEASIEQSVDYDLIYEYATEVLGMQYPQRYQILTYEGSESGYVRQLEEIPSE